MGFRQVCKEAGTERPSSSVLFGLPQSPGRALPFCFSGQLPGPVCSGGKLRSPGMGAPPVRVLLLDVSRETPRKSLPRGSKPQEGNVQGASQSGALQHHRPPRTCVLTQLTTYLGVQGEGCKGHREGWTGVEGAAMPSPKENSCRLVHRWAVGAGLALGHEGLARHHGPRPSDTHHTDP